MPKPTAPAQPEIDDEAEYDVALKGVAVLGRMRLLPRDAHVIRGDALRRLIAEQPEAIESYQVKG